MRVRFVSLVPLFFLPALVLLGCKSKPHRHLVHKLVIHVYDMSDGSRAYQGIDGYWYWWIMSNSSSSTLGSGSSWGTVTTGSTTSPSPWVRTSTTPFSSGVGVRVVKQEEITEKHLEDETSSTLIEIPEVGDEVVVEEENGTESPATSKDMLDESSPESPQSESSPSDSGSSDSLSYSGGSDGGSSE